MIIKKNMANGLLVTTGATKRVLLATEVESIAGILSAYKDEACMTDEFADGKSEVAPAT
jgi:CMP-2-keto-3-deoxyoctulosonic acid synthetase